MPFLKLQPKKNRGFPVFPHFLTIAYTSCAIIGHVLASWNAKTLGVFRLFPSEIPILPQWTIMRGMASVGHSSTTLEATGRPTDEQPDGITLSKGLTSQVTLEILGMILAGRSLQEVLTCVVRVVEAQREDEGMLCQIMLISNRHRKAISYSYSLFFKHSSRLSTRSIWNNNLTEAFGGLPDIRSPSLNFELVFLVQSILGGCRWLVSLRY